MYDAIPLPVCPMFAPRPNTPPTPLNINRLHFLISPCHAWGHEFESRTHRQASKWLILTEIILCEYCSFKRFAEEIQEII